MLHPDQYSDGHCPDVFQRSDNERYFAVGLALGVGMLVDNSIVVIENIYRMRNEEHASAKEAAIQGARQVAGAIMASTLTTVCVFLPIVFTEGIARQLFVDMGLTIAYSLLASLIVALTLVQ